MLQEKEQDAGKTGFGSSPCQRLLVLVLWYCILWGTEVNLGLLSKGTPGGILSGYCGLGIRDTPEASTCCLRQDD